MRRIIHLVTKNFKLYYKLQLIIPTNYKLKHHFDFTDINITELVIVDQEYESIPLKNVQLINPNSSLSEMKKVLVDLIKGVSDVIVIGIDPGHNIGLAVLYNNFPIETNVVYTVEKAILWISQIKKQFRRIDILIKIGDGATDVHSQLIRALTKIMNNRIQIEVVDERRTSLKDDPMRTIHENAAVRIARRKGTKVSF